MKAGAHTGQHCAGKGPQSLLGADDDPAEDRLAEPRRGAISRTDTGDPTQPCGGSSPRALGAPEQSRSAGAGIGTASPPSDTDIATATAAADRTATTRARRSGSQDPASCSRGPGPTGARPPNTSAAGARPPSTSAAGARRRSAAARPTGTARARGAASRPATCSCATSGTRTKGTQVFNSDVLMGFQHLLR